MHYQSYEQFRVLSLDFLSPDICDKIILENDNNYELKEQEQYRLVNIKSIDINEVPNLANALFSANNYFKLDLYQNMSECFFAKYEEGMHYQQLHMDCIAGESQRKLTFTLMLNDEYNGGELKLLQGEKIETKKGKLNVFPSFLPHCVTPVTKGTRYVIFGWFYGPNFR